MSGSERYRVNSPSIVSEVIDGEVVMINLDTGSYYSAGKTGAVVWEALARGASLGDIAGFVAARFDGKMDEIETAVAAFVEKLLTEQLIVADASLPPPALSAGPASGAKAAFQAPRIERYDDMRDLLLADPIHDVDQAGWPNLRAGPRPE